MIHVLCNIKFQSRSQIYTDYLDVSLLIKEKYRNSGFNQFLFVINIFYYFSSLYLLESDSEKHLVLDFFLDDWLALWERGKKKMVNEKAYSTWVLQLIEDLKVFSLNYTT